MAQLVPRPGAASIHPDSDADDAALEPILTVPPNDGPGDGTPCGAAEPRPGRLAHLRRRYHELGAANPMPSRNTRSQARLEALETQGTDLRAAIVTTRELIVELDTTTDQFRTTFAALETAFERRFEQLFGGGFAKLSLTDPFHLGSTGVDRGPPAGQEGRRPWRCSRAGSVP